MLPATEHQTAVAEALEQAYSQAEDLDALMSAAAEDPASVLEALEQELAENPSMQAELAALAAEAASSAAQQLSQAASNEAELGEAMQRNNAPRAGSQESAAAQQQQAINDATQTAATELARAARHQGRVGDQESQQALSNSSEEARAFADREGEGGNALQQLATPTAPETVRSAVEAAERKLESNAAAAAHAADQAARTAGAIAANAAPPANGQRDSAASLAQALDSLDRAFEQMAPASAQRPTAPRSDSGPTSNAHSPTSQSVEAAAGSIASAQAQQERSMAQARARGATPGAASPPSGQSVAENSRAGQSGALPSVGQPGQSPTGGGNTSPTGAYSLTTGAAADRAEDWGRLPPKFAKDIIEARREGFAPDYRDALESYYKAIADRAQSSR